MAKYGIELWSKDGHALADIRQLTWNLSWSKKLNDAETLSFDIDLTRFERLLAQLGYGEEPFGLMDVGSFDIRVKRDGQYLFGANIIRFTYSSSFSSVTVQVEATGYLNYYKNRYFTGKFTNTAQSDILWSVINSCNAKRGGDYGIRLGAVTGAVVKRDREYTRKEVKSLFTQLADVVNGPDFAFTADKYLNIYAVKGTYRPTLSIRYPGNIASFSFARSVDNVSNFVYGIGAGNGEDAIYATAEDTSSEDAIYRRERIITYNSVSKQDTLQQHTDAVLHYTTAPIELPSVTLKGSAVDLNRLDVGDTIDLQINRHPMLSHINGNYRVQEITCHVDENDSEDVTLNFDDIDIDAIIAQQDEEEV